MKYAYDCELNITQMQFPQKNTEFKMKYGDNMKFIFSQNEHHSKHYIL